MEQDILPDLLATIEKEFDKRFYDSKKLEKAFKLLEDKKATYVDVNAFSVEVGKILADVFKLNVTTEILPDGKMYFNIADRLLNTTLSKNHELISSFAVDVQKELNRAAGIGIKSQTIDFQQDKVEGLINKISASDDFEKVKWLLNEPIVIFSQSIVDEIIKANVEFHGKSGLDPVIKRTVSGHKPCQFCKDLEGEHEYDDYNSDDIYTRHERCRCTIEYIPEKGKKELVSSSSYKQNRVAERERKKIEKRKKIGIKNKE